MTSGWGSPGISLLPKSLRKAWANEELPAFFAEELSSSGVKCVCDLDASALSPGQYLSNRGRAYLLWLFKHRVDSIKSLPAVESGGFSGLRDNIPWNTRTSNVIKRAIWLGVLSEDPCQWTGIRIGEFLSLKNVGPSVFFDFACSLESCCGVSSEQTSLATTSSDLDAPEFVVSVEPWMRMVSSADRRFSHCSPPGEQFLSDWIEIHQYETAQLSAADSDESHNIVLNARATADRISALLLEEAISDFVSALTGFTGKRLSSILDRLHFSGKSSAATLESAAEVIGVTRERARQLQQRFEKRVPKHPIFLPQLDRALSALERCAPMSVTKAARLLFEEGISEAPFFPQSIFELARRLGRSHPLLIQAIADESFVATEADIQLGSVVWEEALRLSEQSGVFHVDAVAGRAELRGYDIGTSRVGEMLDRFGDFEDLKDGWYWQVSRVDSFVAKVATGMLRFIDSIGIPSLRDGIGRAIRYANMRSSRTVKMIVAPPPRDALARYFCAHPAFICSGSTVSLSDTNNLPARVSPTELAIGRYIQSAPYFFVERERLLDLGSIDGISETSISLALSYSPYFENPHEGIWTIRGLLVDPIAVAETSRRISSRETPKRVVDFGWRDDGTLFFSAILPRFFDGLVLKVPAGIRRYVAGRSFYFFDDGIDFRVDDSGAVLGGYKRWLRIAGADENDIVSFVFDLSQSTVSVEVVPG